VITVTAHKVVNITKIVATEKLIYARCMYFYMTRRQEGDAYPDPS